MFPMIPMIVFALAGTGLYAQKKRGENRMTPERTVIYNHALQNLKDPDKLRTLSAAFEEAGLSEQAEMLMKRATIRELPTDVKHHRRVIFRQGMASLSIPDVTALAESFDKEGCTDAAKALRARAVGLKVMLNK